MQHNGGTSSVKLFDAHCDTIGKIVETGADFIGDAETAAGAGEDGALAYHPGGKGLHVTLPGLRAAGVCAQVFASWAWTERYKGREFETAMTKVEAVRRLCDNHPNDLFFALTGAQIAAACETGDPKAPIAAVASLEGADALMGDIDNVALFYEEGVRLLTIAWHDSPFCGSTYGDGSGLTSLGTQLVEACEDAGILVDLSHASDQAFFDVCRVAKRPFIASHSNCRSLCPSPRNLTDDMIREIAKRGGVVGITLAPGFLSADYYQQTKAISEEFWRSVREDGVTVDEAGKTSAEAEALVPRPPLDLIVQHVRHALKVGGEDVVALGGDLDGVDALPDGFAGVQDYPRVIELLATAGLTEAQIEKICYRNLARVFRETVV